MQIRPDLVDAHRLAWQHLASPGSTFTGLQRLELATTVLLAVSDLEPAPPWSAITTSSETNLSNELSEHLSGELAAPNSAHDLAYRLGRHAGTMTHQVYTAAVDALGELAYVEVCAIVSTTAAVAHFCRNAGVDLPPFPEPRDGEPTGAQADELVAAALNWVPVAAPADQLPAVIQAYSSLPAELENTWRMGAAQYMPAEEMVHPDWMRRPGGLTRPESETIAARVAQLRECFY